MRTCQTTYGGGSGGVHTPPGCSIYSPGGCFIPLGGGSDGEFGRHAAYAAPHGSCLDILCCLCIRDDACTPAECSKLKKRMKQADDFYTNHTNKWILVVGLLGVLLALGATSIATGTWMLVGVSILLVAMWLASNMGGMAHAREGVSDECWQCVMSKGKSAGISADDEFVNLLGSELLGHLGLPGKRLVNSILGSISNIIGAGIDTNPHDDWTKPLLGSWGYVI